MIEKDRHPCRYKIIFVWFIYFITLAFSVNEDSQMGYAQLGITPGGRGIPHPQTSTVLKARRMEDGSEQGTETPAESEQGSEADPYEHA